MKTFADYGIDIKGDAGEVDTTCPQCSPTRKKSKDPCLSVNTDTGVWFCHHCGWGGSLAEVKEFRPKAYSRPKFVPVTNLPDKVLQFFKERRITQEVLLRNKIGSGKVFMPQLDSEASVIQFPYYRGEELINIKHRGPQKSFRMEKGAERILYGLNDIAETTIIVEGEIDKLSVEMAGYKNCVSVPDGAPTPNTKNYASKFEFLEADKERLGKVKKWIIAVDSDEPGKRLEDELSRRLGREKCLRVEWPAGCKDANDVLKLYSAIALADMIHNAKPYPIKGAFSVLDMSDRVLNLYENGWERGVSTGWPMLDEYYRVRPGEFTVVTGIPNSGKSNWLDALIVNIAKGEGWNIAIFSPENQPLEDHIARIVEKWTKEPFDKGPNRRISRESLQSAMKFADEHFHWILPDDDTDWTLETILDTAKQLVFQKGIRGLVIDPWNELEHMRPEKLSETEYISKSLKQIRNFGRKYGVHIWVVAHPAKLYRGNDGRYPLPTMYDISGSAHWRNKADNGVCVWRDFNAPNSEVEVHVQKIRFKQNGKIGFVGMKYDPVTGSYGDNMPVNYTRRQ